jgi:hypothetical protein
MVSGNLEICGMSRILIRAAACLAALLVSQAIFAQPMQLEVSGRVNQPLLMSRADLLALARRDYAEQRTVIQDGKEAQVSIRYQGVPLKTLLDRAGIALDRREVRKAMVLVTAKDGYQASFSWGELYNSGLGDGVIVVLRQGEDELLDVDGLPALRSLQDLRSGPRHVRWLQRIELLLPVAR